MNGSVFWLTIRQNWRKMLAWGIGMGVLNLITISFVPDMDVLKQYEQLFSTLPPALLSAFGIGAGQALTPDNFITSLVSSRILLFLSVYAVLAGLSITANEEDEGIMDSIMALPIARRQWVGERLLAHFLMAAVVVLLMFMGILIGTRLVTLEFTLSLQFAATITMFLPIVVMITGTAFFSVVLRYRTSALAVSAIVVIASFFLDTLGAAVSEGILPVVRRLSFFAYNAPSTITTDGIQWGEVAFLMLIIGLLTAGTLYFWQRRDIGL